jgi:hypothetical protein
MQLDVSKVYTFKLSSGEELVAKVTSIDGDWITVSHPVAVAPSPQGMALVPALFTADHEKKISINITMVSMIATTDSSVKNKYTEATTGIALPEKKLVFG